MSARRTHGKGVEIDHKTYLTVACAELIQKKKKKTTTQLMYRVGPDLPATASPVAIKAFYAFYPAKHLISTLSDVFLALYPVPLRATGPTSALLPAWTNLHAPRTALSRSARLVRKPPYDQTTLTSLISLGNGGAFILQHMLFWRYGYTPSRIDRGRGPLYCAVFS